MQGDEPGESEVPICPHCAAPPRGHENFCGRCGCPLTFQAVSMPYEQTFARGFAYREGSSKPRNTLPLVGRWVMVGPAFLVCLAGFVVLLFASRGISWEREPLQKIPEALFGLGITGAIATVSGLLLYKTTRSHLKLRRVAEEEHEEDDGKEPSPDHE